MSQSDKQICEPCRTGAPPASSLELAEFQSRYPHWQIKTVTDEPRVQREYSFPDFAAALEFANKVGALAEEQNHHPLLQVEWGKVLVAWWTHKIKNIHQNDLLMAAKTEELFGNTGDGIRDTGV